MSGVISDVIISSIDKIIVNVDSKRVLRAEVLDASGNNLFLKKLTMNELNKVLDAYFKKNPSKTIPDMISNKNLEIDYINVSNDYEWNNFSFSKVRMITNTNVNTVDYKKINQIQIGLNSTGLVGTIRLSDGSTMRLADLDAINALLDVFYANGVNNISELLIAGLIILYPSDVVIKKYAISDAKHFEKRKYNVNVADISKVNVDLKLDGSLLAIVQFNDGSTLNIDNSADVNDLLNKISTNLSKTLPELIASGMVIVSARVNSKYKIGADNKSFSLKNVSIDKVEIDVKPDGTLIGKVKYSDGTEKNLNGKDDVNAVVTQLGVDESKTLPELITAGKVVVSALANTKYEVNADNKSFSLISISIDKVEINVKSDGTLVGKVKYSDGTEKDINGKDDVNAVVTQLGVDESKTLPELITAGKVVVSALANTKYEVSADNKSFALKTATVDKVEIDVKLGGTLVGKIKYSDGTEKNINGKDDVNAVVTQLGVDESKTLPELITAGKVVVSQAVNNKYKVAADNKSFALKSFGNRLKNRIKLRTVVKKPLALLTAVVIAGVGIGEIANLLRKKSSDSSDSGKVYVVDINEDGNLYQSTYNLNNPNERVIVSYIDGTEDMNNTPVNENVLREYDYQQLGSNIDEDMATQLDVIDRAAVYEDIPFQFENLVVANDYDAIYALNCIRNSALNGGINNYTFIDTLVRYMFENDNYVNGSFIESYNSLHPYAQYIVVRMSQGALEKCRDYNSNGYDHDRLVNNYDVYGSDLYEILTQKEKTR